MESRKSWSKDEIEKLSPFELAKLYGELKQEEAREEMQFMAAVRTVAVSGIRTAHKQCLDEISLIETEMKKKIK